MIEIAIKNYLTGVLSVPVYLEIPKSGAPASYVVVEKTGSGITNHIRRVMIY